MTNFPYIRFYTENERLPSKPIHKPTFDPKFKHVTTHAVPFNKVAYPYNKYLSPSIRHVPFSHFQYTHSHLKGLHAHGFIVKEEHLQHPEELGIKEETKKITIPNEAVYEMGLQNTSVEKFAIANLQEEAGTVNNITLHRDDQKYENVPMNKFMDTYGKYVEDKLILAESNQSIEKLDATDIAKNYTPENIENMKTRVKETAAKKIKHKLTTRLVQPIETLAPTETIFQRTTRSRTNNTPAHTPKTTRPSSPVRTPKTTRPSSPITTPRKAPETTRSTAINIDEADDDDDAGVEKTVEEKLEEGGEFNLFAGLQNRFIIGNIKDEQVKYSIMEALQKAGHSKLGLEKMTVFEAKEYLGIPVKKSNPPKPPAGEKKKKSDSELPPPPKSDEIREGENW